MLHFDKHKDNIDSYLRRFKRYAALQNREANDWAIYLSALLKEKILKKKKALKVYSRLTETEAQSHTTLKDALLRKYQLTVEGFKRQFYAVKRKKDETASQFVCRIKGYLDRWIQLAKIEKKFESLRELIIKEQYLSVCEEHLAIYLRERNPKELTEVVKLADTYLDARLQREGKEKKTKPQSVTSEQLTEKSVQETNNNTRLEDMSRHACFHCHQTGHIRKHCALYR